MRRKRKKTDMEEYRSKILGVIALPEKEFLEYLIECCDNTGNPDVYGLIPPVLQLCKMRADINLRIMYINEKLEKGLKWTTKKK